MLFKLRAPSQGKTDVFHARFKFLRLLGEQLLKPNILLRAQYPNGLNRSTKDAIKTVGVDLRSQRIQQSAEPPRKRRCQLCPRKMDKEVKQQCNECKKHCCNQHSKELRLYYDCVEESVVEE